MTHVLSAAANDLIACVLRDNLFSADGECLRYVVCKEAGHVESVYIGEIGAAQAHSADQNAVLDASSASDVSSSASSRRVS
ncbi:late expression factor 10 [Dasychira pudibunda nucleopolyhedrovirus]|nr:late expression factor 10 [Dasychira pudibunda nucleopolyhedrovirus]WHM28404.1 lef-10 [Dasychira pudibunda nucleopolyhedrovirus]